MKNVPAERVGSIGSSLIIAYPRIGYQVSPRFAFLAVFRWRNTHVVVLQNTGRKTKDEDVQRVQRVINEFARKLNQARGENRKSIDETSAPSMARLSFTSFCSSPSTLFSGSRFSFFGRIAVNRIFSSFQLSSCFYFELFVLYNRFQFSVQKLFRYFYFFGGTIARIIYLSKSLFVYLIKIHFLGKNCFDYLFLFLRNITIARCMQ